MYVLLNDTHLIADRPVARLDDAPTTLAHKFEFVLQWAKNHGATILHGGDLFDAPRSWRTLAICAKLLKQYRVPFYSVSGQHDDYFYNEDTRRHTAMGILVEAGLINMLSHSPTTIGTDIIYGASYGQEAPELTQIRVSDIRILVIHKMIVSHKLWDTQDKFSTASLYLRKHNKFNLILCGDAHQKFCHESKGRYIVNSGPLLRAEASVDMFEHHPGFWVRHDDGEMEWIEVPHKPAEQVLSRRHLEETERVDELLDQFIAQLKVASGENIKLSFTDNLISFIRDNEIPEAVKVIISKVMDEVK